jgi:t-SNARE complex subunit (syntaxin)
MEAEGLSQEDVKTLERQQKELAKLIGELQEAIKKHEESVRAWRKRMKLGGAVKDLNYAITYGRVETITGDDMARLVTQL